MLRMTFSLMLAQFLFLKKLHITGWVITFVNLFRCIFPVGDTFPFLGVKLSSNFGREDTLAASAGKNSIQFLNFGSILLGILFLKFL